MKINFISVLALGVLNIAKFYGYAAEIRSVGAQAERAVFSQSVGLAITNAFNRVHNERTYFDAKFQAALFRRRAESFSNQNKVAMLHQAMEKDSLAENIQGFCDSFLYKKARGPILQKIYKSPLYRLCKGQVDEVLGQAETIVQEARTLFDRKLQTLCNSDGISDTDFIIQTNGKIEEWGRLFEQMRMSLSQAVDSVPEVALDQLLAQAKARPVEI